MNKKNKTKKKRSEIRVSKLETFRRFKICSEIAFGGQGDDKALIRDGRRRE